MKLFYAFIFMALITLLGLSDLQAQKFPALDKSPADIATIMDGDKNVLARVVYSRPQKNGRDIFGELVPYGKIWRTGANEATTITFFEDVTVGGKKVEAGTYALFTIPGEDTWEVILNSESNQWGAYRYNQEMDVVRFTAEAMEADDTIEAFAITSMNDASGNTYLVMGWDKTMVRFPISN